MNQSTFLLLRYGYQYLDVKEFCSRTLHDKFIAVLRTERTVLERCSEGFREYDVHA